MTRTAALDACRADTSAASMRDFRPHPRVIALHSPSRYGGRSFGCRVTRHFDPLARALASHPALWRGRASGTGWPGRTGRSGRENCPPAPSKGCDVASWLRPGPSVLPLVLPLPHGVEDRTVGGGTATDARRRAYPSESHRQRGHDQHTTTARAMARSKDVPVCASAG